MSAATPEDIANVAKLLERIRTGELNLIPAPAGVEERSASGKSVATLQRVETLLSAHLRRMQEPAPYNEPAFPIRGALADYQFPGATLRDEFAGQALQGLLANPERYRYIAAKVESGELTQDEASAKNARKAYLMADAMLKARQS